MDIAQLLAFGVKQGASDLHLSAGLPPIIRVDGDIRRISVPEMDHKQVHHMIYDIMSDKQRKDYEEFMETDFSFEIPGLARFRVNAFTSSLAVRCGGWSGACCDWAFDAVVRKDSFEEVQSAWQMEL